MDNKILENAENFDYTIVLDGSYNGPEIETADDVKAEKDSEQEKMDRLYYEYERMSFRDPNVLDKDDAYPHSYQWRIGDKYDPAKKPVLEEAIEKGVRITDTEAYENYVEEIKHRKFTMESWD